MSSWQKWRAWMHFINDIKLKKKLQIKKRGGEQLMFDSELTIGSIRAQSEHLKRILNHLEADERWKNNSAYYAKEISEVEKCLRMIRKNDIESINRSEVYEAWELNNMSIKERKW
jgi:hypothetical protein